MTPKWKAKEVKKLEYNRQYKYWYSCLSDYETINGELFSRVSLSSKDCKRGDKFYLCKYSGEHRSVEYRYWIYEIPYDQAFKTYSSGYQSLNYFNDAFFVMRKKV